MPLVYSPTATTHPLVRVTNDCADPDIDMWAVPDDHPWRKDFEEVEGLRLKRSVDEAAVALVCAAVELVLACDKCKSEAWTRKEGQSKAGGLNAAGRAAYNKAHHAHLKKPAPSGKRHVNLCKRMNGMKKKLTSAKTANDPDSRINKSLRAWHC